MDGLIKYNHAGIDTASMEIATSSKTMNGQLDDLKAALRDIESRWEGAGFAAYLAQKVKGTLLRRTSTWYLPRSARRFRRATRTCPRRTPRWATPSAVELDRNSDTPRRMRCRVSLCE